MDSTLIWYSQEARPYALALLGVLLSFLSYLTILERSTLAGRAAYVMSTAGVFYAHYVFGFIAVVQLLHLSVVRGTSWLRSKEWPLTFLALGALSAPGAPQLLSLFLRRSTLNWVPPTDWLAPWRAIWAFLDIPTVALVALSVLLAGFSAPQARSLLDRSRASLLLAWFVVPIVAFRAIPPLFGASLFFARYLLFTLPAALLLTAWLMALARPHARRRWIPLATFLLMTVLWYLIPSLVNAGAFVRHTREGWSRAVPDLARAVESDDVILYSSGFVEADQVRRDDADPLMVSFIRSPVTANLPAGRTLDMIDLPFRVDDQTRSYVVSVLGKAAGARRVWIIGMGQPLQWAALVLVREASFRVVSHQSYGFVQLVLLEPDRP
jgi:hypothetical protein